MRIATAHAAPAGRSSPCRPRHLRLHLCRACPCRCRHCPRLRPCDGNHLRPRRTGHQLLNFFFIPFGVRLRLPKIGGHNAQTVSARKDREEFFHEHGCPASKYSAVIVPACRGGRGASFSLQHRLQPMSARIGRRPKTSKPPGIPLHWILMRLFTAIDLPAEMLEKLRAFLARLRPLAKLRWTRGGEPAHHHEIHRRMAGGADGGDEGGARAVKLAQTDRHCRARRGLVPECAASSYILGRRRGRVSLWRLWRGRTEQAVGQPRRAGRDARLLASSDAGAGEGLTCGPTTSPQPPATPISGPSRRPLLSCILSSNGKYSKLAEFPFHS